MNKLRTYISIATISLSVAASSSAFAEGFLAGVLRDTGVINEEQRAMLDGANDALGNPVDHAAAAAADAVVPGAGRAIETGWAIQRSGVFDGVGNGGNGNGNQGQSNMNAGWDNGGRIQMQPQIQLGNYCLTAFGLAGPGPVQPIGTYCWDAWGNPGSVR